MGRLLHDLFSLFVDAELVVFYDSLVLVLANYNVHVMADLRSALWFHFILVDPRLRWALYLPYLLLISIFELGHVLGRLEVLNLVVIGSLHLDWLRQRHREQVSDRLIVRLHLAVDHIDLFDVLISEIAEAV